MAQKEQIIQRLLEEGAITKDEANVLSNGGAKIGNWYTTTTGGFDFNYDNEPNFEE